MAQLLAFLTIALLIVLPLAYYGRKAKHESKALGPDLYDPGSIAHLPPSDLPPGS